MIQNWPAPKNLEYGTRDPTHYHLYFGEVHILVWEYIYIGFEIIKIIYVQIMYDLRSTYTFLN